MTKKKKNFKAMDKARKLEAPGLFMEAQISTKCPGNLSLGGQLDLHDNVTEEAIDAYLTGSKTSAIRKYFDDQMDAYKKISPNCSGHRLFN